MKKIITASLAALTVLAASAEGYQVNTLSARQVGMGHTGVALKLGAQSMFFNPAGMAFMTDKADLGASVNALKPYVKCKVGDTWYESDNDVSTPLMANFGFSLNESWKVGLSFYTPYGSNINWGTNWPGAVMNQKVKLSAFTFQPTVSWRVLPNLAIGAGVTASWGSVDLYKALINPTSFNKVIQLQSQGTQQWPENITPASANLSGHTGLSWGANVGVLYDVNEQWSIGADFRTTSWLKVKTGDAHVMYANEVAKQILSPTLNHIDESEFDAKMPMPYVLSLGIAHHPAKDWTIALDAQFTGWHAYKSLDVVFHDQQLPGAFDQHIAKDYKSSWAFRIGAEHNLNAKLDLRAGISVDQSPINDAHYNPETPGMTKLEPSVGLSYHIGKFTVDFAALYVAGLGVDDAKCDFEDLLIKSLSQQQPALAPALGSYEKEFVGSYRLHAFNLALGVRYSF